MIFRHRPTYAGKITPNNGPILAWFTLISFIYLENEHINYCVHSQYRPDFPGQFGLIEDARAFCAAFFDWYNYEHYHSGVATPYSVHSGQAEAILQQRK